MPDIVGGVWLERATCPGADAGERIRTWEVIDRDGRVEGTVEVPGHLRVLSVRHDRVLATSYDDLRISYLSVHEVVR